MNIVSFDHIVLCVNNVDVTKEFYSNLLGMEPREERPGKWALHFGEQKISLQAAAGLPEIARGTTPGSGNSCLIASDSVDVLVACRETSRSQDRDSCWARMSESAPPSCSTTSASALDRFPAVSLQQRDGAGSRWGPLRTRRRPFTQRSRFEAVAKDHLVGIEDLKGPRIGDGLVVFCRRAKH